MSELRVLPGLYAVCRLPAEADVPPSFFSATRTPNELSVVCAEGDALPGAPCERGFRIFEVAGPLDFALFQGERKLDIEVDGENYHRNWDGELCRRDQLRSRRLADLGWDIVRFWVYEIRDDLDGAVRRVKAWMENA